MVKYSKTFEKILKEYEFIKELYEKKERNLIILKNLYFKNPNINVTISSDDEILIDENGNIIVDSTKGNVISLGSYYFKKKEELEEIKKLLEYTTKKFNEISEICYRDYEKYKKIEGIKNQKELDELILFNKPKDK